MGLSGIVDALHESRCEDVLVDVAGELFAGAHAADEAGDFVLEHVVGHEFGLFVPELAVSQQACPASVGKVSHQ